MRLFLASEAKHPDTITKLEEYIGGLKGKSVVYIPTADNGENNWGSWKNSKTLSLVKNLGAIVKIVLLEDFRDRSVISQLKDADIIWFMGGMPGYLAYWMRRCSLDLELPKILKSNILYVGSSAGSMVAGETLDIADWVFTENENERGGGDIKPLKLVNFDILPHFEDCQMEKIKQNYKGNKLYLLKNGEEIIVEDNKVTVVGEERIISSA